MKGILFKSLRQHNPLFFVIYENLSKENGDNDREDDMENFERMLLNFKYVRQSGRQCQWNHLMDTFRAIYVVSFDKK